MKKTEDVDKNLMNHGKTESHAQTVQKPVEVESRRVMVPHSRKNDGKGNDLSKDVAKEELEFSMQSAPHHDGSDAQLEDRMSHPERIVEKFNFVAHLFRSNASQLYRLNWNGGPVVIHSGIPWPLNNVSLFQPSVQCTEVIASDVTVVGTQKARLPSC